MQTVINGIIGVLNAFAVIALIAAGFGIINTLLMSVQERTREIGLMKAMGMSGGKIYALFSAEAVFIGFLGSAIGALAAIGVGSLISINQYKLEHAALLRDKGFSMKEITAKTGLKRTTLYRHLPPRSPAADLATTDAL